MIGKKIASSGKGGRPPTITGALLAICVGIHFHLNDQASSGKNITPGCFVATFNYLKNEILSRPSFYGAKYSEVQNLSCPPLRTIQHIMAEWKSYEARLRNDREAYRLMLAIGGLLITCGGATGVLWQTDIYEITKRKLSRILRQVDPDNPKLMKMIMGKFFVLRATDCGSRFSLGHRLFSHRPDCFEVGSFLHEIVLKYGVPLHLRMDMGGEFNSFFVKEACEQLGIVVTVNDRHKPEQNGFVENTHFMHVSSFANEILKLHFGEYPNNTSKLVYENIYKAWEVAQKSWNYTGLKYKPSSPLELYQNLPFLGMKLSKDDIKQAFTLEQVKRTLNGVIKHRALPVSIPAKITQNFSSPFYLRTSVLPESLGYMLLDNERRQIWAHHQVI